MELLLFGLLVLFIVSMIGMNLPPVARPLDDKCPKHPGVTRCVCRGNL